MTGLPRSRTAWFAAYLSAHPDVWCWHEGLKGCYSKKQFRNKMQPWGVLPAEMHIGNSDSVLPLTNFQELFPDAATVIIHREPMAVVSSVQSVFGELTDDVYAMLDATAVAMGKLQGLHVEFEKLDEWMPTILSHIGIEYRQDIHMLFKNMWIETKDLTSDPEALAVWI